MSSLKQWWHLFSANKNIFFGGTLPIVILIIILGCFSLLHSNSLKVLNHLFQIEKYSLILKSNTPEQEVNKLLEFIQKNKNVSNIEKVTPAQAKKDLLENFDNINKSLQSFDLKKFPYVIEFSLKESASKSASFLNQLNENPFTYNLVSGLDSSSQIESLFMAIRVIAGFFLFLLAISVFYIVNHSIQVIFLSLNKEIEILLILGASRFFIYTPFILNGFFMAMFGFLIGCVFTYILFLLGIAFISFDESSFFIKEIATFFPLDFLILSALALASIAILSSWTALYNVIQKIEI